MASKNLEDQFRPTKGANGKVVAISIYVGFFLFCAIFGFGTFYLGQALSGKKMSTRIDKSKVRMDEPTSGGLSVVPGNR